MPSFSYFSGAQVSLYLGPAFLDEAVYIQYELQDTKKPYYGYASHEFDGVLPGRQLVTGTLIVNFIENQYMPILADYVAGISKGIDQKRLDSIFGISSENLKAGGTELENKIKQELSRQNLSKLKESANDFKEIIRNETKDLFTEERSAFKDKSSDSSGRIRQPHLLNSKNPLDIYILYGTPGDSTFTSKRIKNIQFTGQSQEIRISGDPIGEIHTFFARSVE
jgi:hypothetical protein